MQNTEKASNLVASSKIQEGLSFRDRLRSTIESKKTDVEVTTNNKKVQRTPAVESHAPSSDIKADESPILLKDEESAPATDACVNEYPKYFESCDELTFLEGRKPCLDTPTSIPHIFQSESLVFAQDIDGPAPSNFFFGRRTGHAHGEVAMSSMGKQTSSYVPTNLHSVRPPTLHDSKPIFNQPWLAFSEHSDRTPDHFNGSSERTGNVDTAFHQYNKEVTQPEMIPGYKRDFLFPNRKPSNFPRKRQSDFFGRMIPPTYPPMPTAFEYHSPFQMPFHHGMPNPNQTQVPPNFHHGHFMPAFHPPAARQANPTGNEMYGVPNNMNYGAHYPLNYGHH